MDQVGIVVTNNATLSPSVDVHHCLSHGNLAPAPARDFTD